MIYTPGVAPIDEVLPLLALGDIPEEHYPLWAVARAASFIIPIITVGLLILVDVLAAERTPEQTRVGYQAA